MEEFQIDCETSWLLMESTLSRMNQNICTCVKACFACCSYVIRLWCHLPSWSWLLETPYCLNLLVECTCNFLVVLFFSFNLMLAKLCVVLHSCVVNIVSLNKSYRMFTIYMYYYVLLWRQFQYCHWTLTSCLWKNYLNVCYVVFTLRKLKS